MSRYSVIYADPPWKFSSRGVRSGRFDDLDYDTLSIKKLKTLAVQSITTDNAALFIWVPGAILMESNEVINAWGFKYVRVDSVWEKTTSRGNKHMVCGPWGMNEAEYLLMAVKGSMCHTQIGKRNLTTIIKAKYGGKHSRKPDIFRERIESRFGDVKRIELFARTKPNGWDIWGNELENSIEIPWN